MQYNYNNATTGLICVGFRYFELGKQSQKRAISKSGYFLKTTGKAVAGRALGANDNQ
jgi:hypothetical protein